MNPLQLNEVHILASKLLMSLEKTGDIFPPAENCMANDDCWLFIRKLHRTTHCKIEWLLSRMILDSEKPHMTIEEQFFVRERLCFAMHLSECIDPECKGVECPPKSSQDVRINIEGTTTGHFLL